jgi:hypothetical protein
MPALPKRVVSVAPGTRATAPEYPEGERKYSADKKLEAAPESKGSVTGKVKLPRRLNSQRGKIATAAFPPKTVDKVAQIYADQQVTIAKSRATFANDPELNDDRFIPLEPEVIGRKYKETGVWQINSFGL